MKRGDIWWANLGVPHGSAPGKRLPVLIVQSDQFNASRISTVIVASITSNLLLGDSPGNVRLPVKVSKLKKASVINVSQIVALDKSMLTEKISSVSGKTMNEVNAGLRLVFQLL